ncbi:hypothetical protein A3K80_02235 [Candidatus Bathyarchaeota archaeon RBG_13_38_9]|nr:MAG: hypothetical protein A3K80_02235 [Candidatus Bathyarchaeota archaeon RBG_13_38_9]
MLQIYSLQKKGFLGFGGKKFVIQVKATAGEKVRIPRDDVKKLMKFADKHSAIAVIGVRFSKERWRFWDNEEDSIFSMFDESSLGRLGSSKKDQIELGYKDKSGRKFEKVF